MRDHKKEQRNSRDRNRRQLDKKYQKIGYNSAAEAKRAIWGTAETKWETELNKAKEFLNTLNGEEPVMPYPSDSDVKTLSGQSRVGKLTIPADLTKATDLELLTLCWKIADVPEAHRPESYKQALAEWHRRVDEGQKLTGTERKEWEKNYEITWRQALKLTGGY